MKNTSKEVRYHLSEKEAFNEIFNFTKTNDVEDFGVDLIENGLKWWAEREKQIDIYFIDKKSKLYNPIIKTAKEMGKLKNEKRI